MEHKGRCEQSGQLHRGDMQKLSLVGDKGGGHGGLVCPGGQRAGPGMHRAVRVRVMGVLRTV